MNIVLIWASNNPEKFGNKILKDLVAKWHKVIPVNPKEKEIDWIRCHANLWIVLSWNYDVITFVVPPTITLQILTKYRKKILKKKIWCQPWTSDELVETYLENHNFKGYITESCMMVDNIDL